MQGPQIVLKNDDASNFIEEKFNGVYYIEAVNETFPIKKKAWKFPDCFVMKLIEPKNLEGLDFSSLKKL